MAAQMILETAHKALYHPQGRVAALKHQLGEMIVAIGGDFTVTSKARKTTQVVRLSTAETCQVSVIDLTLTTPHDTHTFQGMYPSMATQVLKLLEEYRARYVVATGKV